MLKVFSTLIFLFIFSLAFSQENKVPLCGTPDSQIIDAKVLERMRNAGKKPNLRMADLPMLECLVAVAVEYKIYLNYNKNQDLIKEKVYEYFEKISKVYENETRIKLTINHLEIITTPREDTLRESRSKLGYNIAHLFTLNNAAPTWGGLASVLKFEDGTYELYCVSGNFNNESFVLKTMAHEIGHCLDSPHTHVCDWPGGPIDICGSPEGNCMINANLKSIGTIMSYCQDSGLSFHPLCREIIRYRAEEILLPILTISNTPRIDLVEQTNIEITPYLTWRNTLKTMKYKIQIAETKAFEKTIIDSTTTFNFFQAHSLENGKTYFWRLKALNEKGESDWSNTGSFSCTNEKATSIPAIKGAFLDRGSSEKVRLEVYPLKNISEYEFRLTNSINYTLYGFTKTQWGYDVNFRVSTPFLDFNELNRGDFLGNDTFYWQTRVINNGKAGEWTPIHSFTKFKPIIEYYPIQASKLCTSFPIVWEYGSAGIEREYVVQVALDKDFTNIHYQKTRLINTLGTPGSISKLGMEVVENLKPNKQYFYRYKEKNGGDKWNTSTFQTGKENSKWRFMNPLNSPYWESCINFSKKNSSTKFIFGNETGIYQTDGVNWGNTLNPVTTNGLIRQSNSYKSATIDNNNNVYYIGVDDFGNENIYKYDGSQITNISKSLLPEGIITNIYSDNAGVIHTLKYNVENNIIYIFKYVSEKWYQLPPIKIVQSTAINLKFDNKNIPLLQVVGEGIFRFNSNNWELMKLNSNQDVRFTFDSKNFMWWMDSNNIYKQDSNKNITTYRVGGEIPYGIYKNLIFDKNEVLWVIAEINQKIVLLKFKDEKWSFDSENILPIPIKYNFDNFEMAIDNQNRLWLFSYIYGIFIYDDSGQVKSQNITAENITNKKSTDKPFRLVANANSGLSPIFKVITGPAIIQKDSIILTGKGGKVIIQISQPGNEIYEPAKNVELTFEVTAKATQTISFAKIEQKTLAEKSFTLSATTTSALPIIFQIISGPATVNGNVVTLTGTGRVLIKAIQNGNAEFLAANEVIQEFCVIPAKPIISVNAANNWMLEVNADKNLQWYFDGKKVENGTKNILLATQNGQYKVEVFNSDASCGSNTSDTFQLLILANEDDKSQLIKVFPNPADDWVMVDSENLLKINSIKLYDLKGSLLYAIEKTELPHKIKIQHSWQGNVLLEIKTSDKTYLKKLVLN